MAVSVVGFARAHRDARLLLTLRRRDLVDAHEDDPNPNAPVRDAVARLAHRVFSTTDERALDRVTRAVVDVPYAAVRRHRRLPGWLEHDVALAARALVASPPTSPNRPRGSARRPRRGRGR